MTNNSPYGAILSDSEAIKELEIKSGTQFDSEIVRIFVGKVLGNK